MYTYIKEKNFENPKSRFTFLYYHFQLSVKMRTYNTEAPLGIVLMYLMK